MVASRKATPFWKRGIFCVRLNVEPLGRATQDIVVGIDPGSKKEGLTVKSAAHTLLNIQADAVTWVKDTVEGRRNARKARRGRNTPCRQPRFNRDRGGLAPSTKARWQWKIRMCAWLAKMYPVTGFVVENIAAMTKKGKPRWNVSFSPLEVGKAWFYERLRQMGTVDLKQGWETKALRDAAGLKKTKCKMADVFEAHCVDSWALANWKVGGHTLPEYTRLLRVVPLQFHRRQLHMFQPAKGGKRRAYGGTRSLGLKRGSLVKHPKHGLCYVGGTMADRISMHELRTGKRMTQNAKVEDTRFLTYNTWRTALLPVLKGGVSAPLIR